jgi:DNA-cytosine methyltransferase
MNVLSLFDGMSCGQLALNRVGIPITNYFASEIDKYAIKVTMANFPNTIQLGSVVDIDGSKLPNIDLLIGGSPCQSFSFAGKRKGMSTKCETEILTLDHYLQLKSEGYEFEGQSYLFWEYMRLLQEVKPKYFLLENVEMGEKWERVLSRAIGVNGIHINSALVSSQNRQRIYWTNIGMRPSGLFGDLESFIEQPKDKGMLLKDILESDVDEKYFLSEKMIEGFKKHNENHNEKKTGFIFLPTVGDKKAACLRANAALCATDNSIIVAMRGRENENGEYEQQLEERQDGKTNTLTSVSKDNLIREVKQLNPSTESGGKQPYQQNRIYDINGISPALCEGKSDLMITSNYIQWDSSGKGNKSQGQRAYYENGKSGTLSRGSDNSGQVQPKILSQHRIRRLTPIECERLQTVPDNYTNYVSDTQRYKMLGNGWTIDVIAHIFSYLNK